MNVALESLDKILREIHRYCGSETEIVMFSDHGMNLEENQRVDLVSTLQRRVFDVVIPAFGLCSYAAVYCRDEGRIPEVARASAEIKGVDFAIYRDGGELLLKAIAGRHEFSLTARVLSTSLRRATRSR